MHFVSGDTQGPITFKTEVFPVDKNVIFVRFENIGDRFDSFNTTLDHDN